MKKIIVGSLFTFFCLSSISLAAPASQDPRGFEQYAWRTDFQTIKQDIGLQPVSESTPEFIDTYEGVNNKIWDSNHSLRISFVYFFYQNQLVGGCVKIYQKEDHDLIAQNIQNLWGRPDDNFPNGEVVVYEFPTTWVYHRFVPSAESPEIYGKLTFHDYSFMYKSIELQTQTTSHP